MSFEDLQKAWQSQAKGPKVIIDPGVLLKEVRRNQQQFRLMILRRDVVEAGLLFYLTAYFLWPRPHTDWTVWLLGLNCFGVGTFLVVDRIRQRRLRPQANDSLKGCVESSRSEVCHQIWLLRNVWWWYLLPLAVGLAVFIVDIFLRFRPTDALAVAGWVACVVFCVLLFWGIYWLNQTAVRKTLQPRLEELDTLLAELK